MPNSVVARVTGASDAGCARATSSTRATIATATTSGTLDPRYRHTGTPIHAPRRPFNRRPIICPPIDRHRPSIFFRPQDHAPRRPRVPVLLRLTGEALTRPVPPARTAADRGLTRLSTWGRP